MTVRKNQAALTADGEAAFVSPCWSSSAAAATTVRHHPQRLHHERHRLGRPGRPPLALLLPWHRRFLLGIRGGAAVRGRLRVAAVLGLDRGPHPPRRRCGRPISSAAPGGAGTDRCWTVPSRTRRAVAVNVRVDGRGYLRRARYGRRAAADPGRGGLRARHGDLRHRPLEQLLQRFPQPSRRLARRQPAQPGARVGRRADVAPASPRRPGVLDAPRLHRQALGRLAGAQHPESPYCQPRGRRTWWT